MPQVFPRSVSGTTTHLFFAKKRNKNVQVPLKPIIHYQFSFFQTNTNCIYFLVQRQKINNNACLSADRVNADTT